MSAGFGVDTGFNEQPSTSCHVGAAENPSGYPMARYKQGEEIVLAWPSKNHVAAPCTNPYIPDTSLELFVAPQAANGHPADEDFTQVKASFSDVPHERGKFDFEGFQNCPAFCENMDKSLCTGSFVVPTDLADGVYTFQWKWVFNRDTAPYITCFEAYVGQDVAPVPMPTPEPTRAGATLAPTVAESSSSEEDCALGMWAQCGGNSTTGCCAGGVTCYRQSEWYSQCRPDCPSGWECADDQTPAPTPRPTPEPTDASPAPTQAPTPSPTCGSSSVDACGPDFGQEGRFVQADRNSVVGSAVMADACHCANFCRIFSTSATAWRFKPDTSSCTCHAGVSGVENGGQGQWVGLISEIDNSQTV